MKNSHRFKWLQVVAQLEYRLLVLFEKKTRANLNVLVRSDHIELERKFIRKQMAGDLLPDVEDLVVPGEDAAERVADGLLTAIAAADELVVLQVVQQPGIKDRRARTERTNILESNRR